MTTSPPSGRVRNPRGSGALLGHQIITTALAVVDDTGAEGLSLRGLARTIGVSPPAIYAHFADIDAILLAVARQVFTDLTDHLIAAGEGIGSPTVRFRAICRAYLEYADQHPGRHLVMFGGQWDATAARERGTVDQDVVDELGLNTLSVFTDAVRACAGAVALPDPVTDSVSAWVFLHGYAHQRIVARAFPWPPGITEHILDTVTTGCLGRSPASE